MRFRLTYEGELRSTQPGNHKPALALHKQQIRKSFHKQLKYFWQTNKFLSETKSQPVDVRANAETSLVDQAAARQIASGDTLGGKVAMVDAVAWQYREHGYRFVPLVRESLSLLCSLDILLLRRDVPGSVITAGDLDNRIKTLIDALRRPRSTMELFGNETPAVDEDPFFCLLEDDALVTRLAVETDGLLDPPAGNKDYDRSQVRAIITVELRPYHVTMFNLSFA